MSGARIALVTLDADAKPELRMLDANELSVTNQIEFTQDGESIVYKVRENGSDNLWLYPLKAGRSRQITSFSADSIDQFQYSPDGKQLGILRRHTESDACTPA